MRSALAAAFSAALLASCAHGQINTPVAMTGCDHPTGWSDQVRAAADETWLYAQMAANAYEPPAAFLLGDRIVERERRGNDEIGFAYVIFERLSEEGEASSWIIAYRGTENSRRPLRDWIYGNLLGRQNARGIAVYRALREKLGKTAEISVTGHSLGGAIATHVSLCEPGVKSYIFNSSPRFWRCNGARIDNLRRSVVEMGEALFVVRGPMAEATQRYTAINCVQRGSSIYQHGMGLLARCLTDIAAWNDAGAKASLARNNLSWPPVDDPDVVQARRRACAAIAAARIDGPGLAG